MIYDSSIFSNVRFFLAGFTPQQHLEVKSKLVSEGGVYVEEYGPDCTHVIVENIVLDDPICVAAKRDGKTLVTSLWVVHSFDYGVPADVNSILYRPPKELNGIPGANELFMSLTGFQGVDRDDIKIMVQLMGAQFSKAMAAHKVTHLICYKFEGEKYEMAKRVGFIKLVNRYWVEDCLVAWRLLPEEDYSKSTYEVEMEAEVRDSEDETEDVIGRKTSGITNLKTNIGEANKHSVLASKVSIPPTQQGFSNSLSVKDKKLLKSDMLTESMDANKLEKQPSRDHRDLSQIDSKSDNFGVQNAKSNQIKNGFRSSSGNNNISGDFDAKPSLNFSRKTPIKTSPQSSRRTPQSKTSLQTAGKYGKLEGRSSEILAEKIIDEVPTFNLETDTEEAASGGTGGSSFERLTNLDAGKHSPLNSKENAGRCSHSLQVSGEFTCQDGHEKSLAETGLFDVKDPGNTLPQKRTAGSNVSHATPKSQKLASSASKRVDAAEPKTGVNSPLEERKSGALKSGSHIGDDSAEPSPNLSSAKSNVNNAAPSRSSDFDMLQGSKPTNIDPLTSPNTNCGSPSLGDGSNKGQLQNLHKNDADSPGINDLEAVKTRSPKLNSGDPNGTSVSKSRKKMVARKTLGSRHKVSKTKADAQGSSVSRSPLPDDSAINSVRQENGEELAPSPAADKVLPSPTVNEPISLASKPHLKPSTEINHNAEIVIEDTGAPPELDMCNEKSQTAGKSHLVKSKIGEAAGELLHRTDEAKVTTSVSKKTYHQDMPLAETVDMEQNLVAQKKGRGVKAKKKNPNAPKEAAKNADKGENGKSSSDKVKESIVGAAEKKSGGTLLLNKSNRSVELENENQHAKKRVNCSGRLASNKKRGAPLTNKSEGLAGKENENEPEFDGNKAQSDGTKLSAKLVASSNMVQSDEEDKNNNNPGVCNDQGTRKVAKCPQKLAGKKRRGTVLLKKSDGIDEVEKENEPVIDCEQHPGKLASAFNILDKPMDDDKENGPALGNDEGTKDGKRAGKLAGKKRRGTLVLNANDEQVDEGKMDKSDGDKSKGGILSEELISNTNKVCAAEVKNQSACFILSGHRLQRKEFQKLIKRLKGKVCRDSHQWSYQASHFIVPDPIRRTEKFFAAAASGSWILKTDYLIASSQAGKFLPEEPYEWHKNGLSEDGAIGLEAPRKWRLLREKTGHGAFYGMRVVIYGECIAPPLDTLKRAVKAGDGTILATSPPYTRFLESIDFAIISPGMPRVDIWVQEFLNHQIPCVLADYLVEYVCKPGYSLDRHVLYNTHEWAAKSFSKLLSLSEEVVTTPDDQASDDLACQACGSTDRGEVMLVCGDETGSTGCGIGTHTDCCDPPLEDIPEEDWFCPKCSESVNKLPGSFKEQRI